MEKELRAYSDLYLEDAQENIADSFDFAVRGIGLSLEEYVDKFLKFKYIDFLETGHPHYIGGMSGVELARLICGTDGVDPSILEYFPQSDYWTGWIASFYQWYRNTTYKAIFSVADVGYFRASYRTMHECDIMKMVDALDRRFKELNVPFGCASVHEH